jgi:hypothetical protein
MLPSLAPWILRLRAAPCKSSGSANFYIDIRTRDHTWHGISGHVAQSYEWNDDRTMGPRSSNTPVEPPGRLVAAGSSGHLPRVTRRGPSAGPVLRSQ